MAHGFIVVPGSGAAGTKRVVFTPKVGIRTLGAAYLHCAITILLRVAHGGSTMGFPILEPLHIAKELKL